MAYGLRVESTYGKLQIDSQLKDVGLTVKYLNTGYNNNISGTLYRPDLGDMLFINCADKTGQNQTNYFSVLEYNSFQNRYFFRRVKPKPGGNWAQPGWYLEDIGTTEAYGYYQTAVVSKQNTISSPTGSYGLKIRDSNNSVTFDSRTFTTDGQFRISAVAAGGTMKPPIVGETDVNFSTQLLALGGWCNIDWSGYINSNNSYVVMSAVKVAAVGGNAQGNFYYGAAFALSTAAGIYNASDIITANITG